MTAPPTKPAPVAGGFLIAMSIIVGVIAGGLLGQPSMGLLAGAAAGILFATLIWLKDRRR